MGVEIPHGKGQFWGLSGPVKSISESLLYHSMHGTTCHSAFRQNSLTTSLYYFARDRGVKYCDQRVCTSVCLSVCLSASISQKPHVQTSRNFLYMLRATMSLVGNTHVLQTGKKLYSIRLVEMLSCLFLRHCCVNMVWTCLQ